MDPKLGFQYQLEQGKKYRFSYEVVSANAKEFIWKNVNFEKII